MNTRSDLTVYIQLLFAMLFFGLSFVFTSYALRALPPVTLIVARLIISTIFLSLLSRVAAVRRIVGTLHTPAKGDRLRFVAIAFFQPFLYFLAENTGLLYASPAIASIVVGTIPVATPVFVWLILRERIDLPTIFGAALSFTGVLFLVLADAEATGADPFGVLLVSGAVVAAVGYSIVLRTLPEHYSAITVVTWQNIYGLVLFVPVFIWVDGSNLQSIFSAVMADAAVPPQSLFGALAFLGIFPSTFSFIFLSRGIRVLGATRANVTTNLVPVFTALFSAIVLGERITLATVTGMAIVISGVLLSQITRIRAREAKRVSV